MSFGSDLQMERERRGVTLEAVADGTKVSLRHLRALESDDLANMPGGVFNRGMVRSYCRFLGLSEEEWLERFSSIQPLEPVENTDLAEFAENVKRGRPAAPPGIRRRWLVVLLLLALLGAAGYTAWKYVLRPRMRSTEPVQPVSASNEPSSGASC